MLLGSLQHTLMVGLLATLGIFLLLTLMLSERTFQSVLDRLRRHHQPVAAKVVNEKSAYGNLVEWIATCRNLFHSKLAVVTLFLLVLGGILYVQALRNHQSLAGFSRSQYQQLELSADLKDWLTVPKRSLTNQLLTWFGLDDSLTKPQPKVDMGGSTSIFALSPGWCRVILALVSIVFACFGLCQHRTTSSLLGLSQLTLGLCCILAWAIVLSMGPASWMNIPSPFTCLAWTFGPLEQMRSPFRFAYWGQSLVIVLAAIAIHWMDQLLRPAEPRTATRGWKSQAATCMTVILGLIAALEVPPSRSMLFDVPHVMMEQTWLEVMRQNTSEKAPVLCLPCAQDPSEISQQRDALWMLYATLHRRP